MAIIRTALCLASLLVFTSCAPPTESSSTALVESKASLPDAGGGGIQPMCVEGCLEVDPAPSGRGYFLPGTENQPSYCADGSIDQDQDGLDDNCEYALALTFAPLLSFEIGDYVDRESRWAARWEGSNSVALMYLHSYYQDNGVPGGAFCQGFIDDCDPHPGDAEWVYLAVEYDGDTHHWYLKDAVLSAHTWHVEMATTGTDTVPRTIGNHHTGIGFEYPDRVAGYPRIYVADGKHANYPTQSYCDAHGGEWLGIIAATDECTNPRSAVRATVLYNQNVGSDGHRLIDCVASQNPNHPAYSLQIQECYWSTGRHFFGWFNFNNNDYGEAYGDILRSAGF